MIRELIKCDTGEKRFLMFLMAMLILFLSMYVYFVNQTIFNVVERRALERDMSLLATEVSELERAHLALKESITRDEAAVLGFYELEQISYLTRVPVALVPLE